MLDFLTIPISTGKIETTAEIAQLVEHTTENCGVPSPNLGLGTNTLSLIGSVFISGQTHFLRVSLADLPLMEAWTDEE